MLKAGQNLLLNKRLWHLRQVQPLKGRNWELEVVGVSEAALGLTRCMGATQYGDELFIQQRQRDYWRGHLRQDWLETERGPALNCRPATWLDLLAAHTRHPASIDTIKNEFSWSYSRAAKYRQCPRAYYYHYYAAWEGWQNDAPVPVQRAYLLKNLTDLPLWVGTLVHDSIKFALVRLKAGQPVAEADLLKQMQARAQADFEDSGSGRYQQKPNQLTGFQEHYYQTGLAAAWPAAQAQAEHYLRTFLNSALYADLQQQPSSTFLAVEELQSFSLAGTKIWVQMDLARQAGDRIYVYDWKTGPVEEAEMRQQLGIYGLYLRQTRPQLNLDLQAAVYLLAEDNLLTFDLDEPLLQEAQAQVEASIAHLRGLLLDPQTNLAELRRFPMIDNLTVCRHCQFRELCGRDT